MTQAAIKAKCETYEISYLRSLYTLMMRDHYVKEFKISEEEALDRLYMLGMGTKSKTYYTNGIAKMNKAVPEVLEALWFVA